MNTQNFWQAIDRLGTSGAALCVWRLELGDELADAMPYLRRLNEFADYIPAPDDRRQRLKLYPRADGTWSAQSDEFPAHRDSLVVTADDVTCFTPDWDALRPALASALGFVPGLFKSLGEANTRQIGIAQPPKSPTLPVFLYLPRGGFSDYVSFVGAVKSLPASVLYVPTARWLEADICQFASRSGIQIEPLAERCAVSEAQRTTLLSTVVPSRNANAEHRKRAALSAILSVKSNWSWDNVTVRLTHAGTLVAGYGDETGQHSFARNTGGIRNFPQFFQTMLELSHHQRWQNPHRSDPTYEARRQAFKRLRDDLRALIPIPGDPFRRRNGAWEPKFDVELDGALDAVREKKFAAEAGGGRRRVTNSDLDDLEERED